MPSNVSARQNASNVRGAIKGVDILVPALIGLLIFWWITGGSILRPTNINWIMSSAGDPVQHYVGWQSFRHTPILQWPIGANWNYGEDLGTSIVFTDSLPLFALVFKLVGAYLPTDFQYSGVWFLCCFILQAVFGWALVRQLGCERIVAAIAAAIFVLTPAMLLRCFGHESLVGQWILLAALNVYFSDRHKTGRWTLVLCLASLIHAYLLAMSLAIWATDAIRLWVYQLDSRGNLLKRLAVNVIALFCTMLAIGYFYPGSTGTWGFGAYRFDLLSFINPEGLWSIFLPGKPHGEDYEGFAYLGAGVILLVVIDLCLMVARRRRVTVDRIDRRQTLPIVILAICLVIYAASNHVAVYGHEFVYPLPRFTTKLTSTFRASGRFAWPVAYLVVLGAIVYFARTVDRRIAIGVLAGVLVLQAVDLSKVPGTMQARWATPWTNPLTSPFWADALRQYRRFNVVPPTGTVINQLAVLAATNGIPINDGEISRVNESTLGTLRSRAVRLVDTASFDPATLYVFSSRFLWAAAISKAKPTDFVGEVNGYKVYAPDWHGCVSTCGLTRATLEPYPDGKITSFGLSGGSDEFVVSGWGTAEQVGRWTEGGRATLAVYVGHVTSPVRITLNFVAFTPPAKPHQRVEILSSGKPVAEWTIGQGEVTREFAIDPANIEAASGFANVTLLLPDHISPVKAGTSTDDRELGVLVKSMTVNY